MQLGEIFTDALKYPLSDYKNWMIVGVVAVCCGLQAVFAQLGIYNQTLYTALSAISLILIIVLMGYGLSVIKEAIDFEDEIPAFDWVKNFVDGIKYIVVAFVYFIIPMIIVSIIGILLGGGPLSQIFTESNMQKFAALNGTVTQADILSIVPQGVWNSLFTAIAVTAIIAIVFFIVFAIFEYIAVCRMAKYDSLGEAFRVREIYSDIREIGILKIIAYLIIAILISSIAGMICAFISAIPYVGIIIAALVGYSFIFLFNNRALGLLYSDV